MLSGADSAPEEIHRTVLRQRRAQERSAPQLDDFIDDSIFETGAHGDDLFFSDPASCLSPEDYDYDADAPDEYDEYDGE